MNEFEELAASAENQNAITGEQQYEIMVSQVNASYQAVVDQEKKAIHEGMKAVVMGLRLGMMLTLLKEQTPHGGWEKLFTGAEKRIGDPNVPHVGHFSFAKSTAQRYMKTYKNSLKNLKGERPDLLSESLKNESPMTIEVVKKATRGAETPRQAMLNLGVIRNKSEQTPSAPHRSTIEQNRNTLGGPKKPEVTPQEAIALAQREATQEINRVMGELMRFINLGRHGDLEAASVASTKMTLRHALNTLDQINLD